jgi:hypothetical protein
VVTAVSERVPGAGNGKITAAHRRRDAVIYVRQSTLAQTQENTESLALQYELRRHAAGLGWDEQQITVIDEDLARSAATASGRLGFTDLVAAVGLGKVGIIIGREVSRLARNNTDWYQVLGAPRGAVYSCGDGRAPPPGRRSGLVKLEAA